MSLYPVPKIMPHTAKVYQALKPVSNRVALKTYGACHPKPSGTGRDSFVWKHWKDATQTTGFRPTQTPWAKNSAAPWANDRTAKRPPKKRLNYNKKSAEAKRQRQKFIIQQQYMRILSMSPRQADQNLHAARRPNTSAGKGRNCNPRRWPSKPVQGSRASVPGVLQSHRPRTADVRKPSPWL